MRIVVKFAGALLENRVLLGELAGQVAALARDGHELLLVHGGGRLFTATLARMGIESRFTSGLRVTDAETRDAAVMVFGGLLNKRLAAAVSQAGQPRRPAQDPCEEAAEPAQCLALRRRGASQRHAGGGSRLYGDDQ